MDYINFSTGNAIDFGDLASNKMDGAFGIRTHGFIAGR